MPVSCQAEACHPPADPSSLDVPLVDTLYLQWDKTHAEDRAGLFGVGHGIKAVPRGRLPWGTGTVKVGDKSKIN